MDFLRGWSDRHGFGGKILGSLQPSRVFCPCPKSTVAQRATFVFSSISVHRCGERNREPGSALCFSCSVHPAQTPPPTESRADAQDACRKTRRGRGSRISLRGKAAALPSGIRGRSSRGPRIRGCPTSCGSGSSGEVLSTHSDSRGLFTGERNCASALQK